MSAPPLSPLRVVVVGHVDHGKSTLIGRLLHETDTLPEGKVAEVEAICRRRGMAFEWAFVTDALQAERDQGVTIDVSHVRVRTPKRTYVLIDAPGHRQFLRNMLSGAADADAALLIVDAAEGMSEQTRRHGFLLHFLGIRQVGLVVNKMDAIGYDQTRFADLAEACRNYLAELGQEVTFAVPVSAREGENVAARSGAMGWYDGPTVLEALDSLAPLARSETLPLRVPVQDVLRLEDRRIVLGRVESGRLRVGDNLLFSPSNAMARVRSIECWGRADPVYEAGAGACVGFTLDQPIFIERGEVASAAAHAPVETHVFHARLFWMGRDTLATGRRLRMRLMTTEAQVRVQSIERVLRIEDLAPIAATTIEPDQVAEAVLRADAMLAVDSHHRNPVGGRFVLIENGRVVGAGLVNVDGYPDQRPLRARASQEVFRVAPRVDRTMREARYGHCGGVLWLTGLSGAGKSTLAIEAERRLFLKGYQTIVIDGDNLRHGLNADLGFSPDARAENIRRAGEVAALFAEAGFVVLTAFISPYRSDRERAKAAAKGRFHEVFVRCGLGACEERDPKGLYAKARQGLIADFTGISAPYEAPEEPDLVVDTEANDIDACVSGLLAYVDDRLPIGRPAG